MVCGIEVRNRSAFCPRFRKMIPDGPPGPDSASPVGTEFFRYAGGPDADCGESLLPVNMVDCPLLREGEQGASTMSRSRALLRSRHGKRPSTSLSVTGLASTVSALPARY